MNRFNIGYLYSFVASALFYWVFMKYFPNDGSRMDHAETGEEIIAAQDAKNVEARRADYAERRPSVVKKIFTV